MKRAVLLLSVSLVLACGEKDAPDSGLSDTADTDTVEVLDADGDGYDAEDDCDDADPLVFPGAEEVCDGVDNDCSGAIDDDPTDGSWFFEDADGDGYGNAAETALACAADEGWTSDDTDCDDTDATANPGVVEVGCDGVDNDCDGSTDVNLVPSDFATVTDAVDALDDGAEICVEPGTVTDVLALTGRTLTITGQRGLVDTIWDLGSAPALTLDNTSLVLQGFTVSGGDFTPAEDMSGGFVGAVDSTLTLADIDFTGHEVTSVDGPMIRGLLVHGTDSEVLLERVDVSDIKLSVEATTTSVTTHVWGGLLWAEGGGLTLVDVAVTGVDVQTIGSPRNVYVVGLGVATEDAALDIDGFTLRENSAAVDAVETASLNSLGIWSKRGTATGANLDLSANSGTATAPRGSGSTLLSSETEGAVWSDVVVEDNFFVVNAELGSANALVDIQGGSISGLSVSGNTADAGAVGASCLGLLLHNSDGSYVDVRGNTQRGDVLRGIVCVEADEGDASLDHFVIAKNTFDSDDTRQVLHAYAEVGDAVIGHGDVVGNLRPETAGCLLDLYGSEGVLSVHDVNLVGDGPGVCAEVDDGTLVFTGNNVHTGEPRYEGMTAPAGDLDADPLYTSTSDTDPWAWDLTLQAGSPAVDAGSADLSDDDGSACDIGAYGGPGGSAW